MSPTTAAFAAGLALLLPAAVRADTQAGQIPCEQDVEQVRQYIETHRSALTPAEREDANQRLGVAASQCSGQAELGQATVAQLRADLRMNAATEQAATPPARER
jgi:hypothetical protein